MKLDSRKKIAVKPKGSRKPQQKTEKTKKRKVSRPKKPKETKSDIVNRSKPGFKRY